MAYLINIFICYVYAPIRNIVQTGRTSLCPLQYTGDQRPLFRWREPDRPRPIGAYVPGRSANPACSSYPTQTVSCPPSPIPDQKKCCAWQPVDKTKPIGLGTCSVTIKIIQNNLEFIRIIQNNSEIFRVIQNNLEAITIQVLTGP